MIRPKFFKYVHSDMSETDKRRAQPIMIADLPSGGGGGGEVQDTGWVDLQFNPELPVDTSIASNQARARRMGSLVVWEISVTLLQEPPPTIPLIEVLGTVPSGLYPGEGGNTLALGREAGTILPLPLTASRTRDSTGMDLLIVNPESKQIISFDLTMVGFTDEPFPST